MRADLERLERDTGRRYGAGARPLLLSVRSGAATSMPGMMDTLLNVGLHPDLAWDVGDTAQFWRLYVQFIESFARTSADLGAELFASAEDMLSEGATADAARRAADIYEEHAGRPFPKDPWALLVECINTVFCSWHSERAVSYRRRNDVRGPAGTAVTVQAMFPSEVSGVLFTRDPNDFAASRMVIEGSYGLGESVVSGDVTPDRFVVNREDFGDVRMTVGRKLHAVLALGDEAERDPDAPCLTDDQVRALCALGVSVEEHFGAPMDVEWGLADGRFALLQSRPIRGLEVAQDVEVGRQHEVARLRAIAGEGRRVWVIHNLAETLPHPTPLTWDIVRSFMSGAGGFGLMYRDLGYRPSRAVREEGFLELIGGQIYADPLRMAQLFWDGVPMVYDPDEVVGDPKVLDRAPGRFDPDQVEPGFLLRLPGVVVGMVRTSQRMKRLRRRAGAEFEAVLPAYLDYVRRKRAEDLTGLSTPQVLSELDERRRAVLDEFGKESLKPGFVGGLALYELTELLTQLAGGDEGAVLANTLTKALEGDLSVEQDIALSRVARGEAGLDDFIARFGHRTVGEMELMEPRWREDRSYLEQMATALARSGGRDPEEVHRLNARSRQEAEAELPDRLARWGGASLREDIDVLLAQARTLLPYRENGKHYLMMGYELIRLAVLELARRWDIGNDVFFLERDELGRFETDRDRLLEAAHSRRVRWQAFRRLDMPDVIDSRALDRLGLPPPAEAAAHRLDGAPAAPGVASGPARIVLDPRQAGDIGVGYVLVCPSTDPAWTSLFINAAALVVERGGVLSHGAIVARDFGIPAVVCPNATHRIPAGAVVRVDGNEGRLTILEEG